VDEPTTDLWLEKMFLARAATLWAAAVLAVLAVLSFFADSVFCLFPHFDLLLLLGAVVTLVAIVAGSSFTCYYTFHVGLQEAGMKYAVGHLLICMALTPVGLTGIIFIPLLVYYDVERWQQSADQ
jgi:hypothetical protein